jgi:hypothetical protein
MPPLSFTCPKTNQQAPTGIETDVQSLSAFWKAMVKVNCPHCGEIHKIPVRERYIQWHAAGCYGPVQVEGVQEHVPVILAVADTLERCEPVVIARDGFAIDDAGT